MNESKVANLAVAGVLALGLTTLSGAALAKNGMEKCKGIAQAGKNDCGANGHSCGGLAKNHCDPNEWIFVPKGTCTTLQEVFKKGKICADANEFLAMKTNKK